MSASYFTFYFLVICNASSIKARELLRSVRVGTHVLEEEKRAHRNRTKRLHSVPVDLTMPRAHTSELDRLRLCQRTDPDLRGFHLQNPPFPCMLMCLCTLWQRGHTWQRMCTIAWIGVHRFMNAFVLISDCEHRPHPWLSDFAHYPPPLLFLWKTAGTVLCLVFSTLSAFLPSFFFLPHYFLLSRRIITLKFQCRISLSLPRTNVQNTSCYKLWRKHQHVFKDGESRASYSDCPRLLVNLCLHLGKIVKPFTVQLLQPFQRTAEESCWLIFARRWFFFFFFFSGSENRNPTLAPQGKSDMPVSHLTNQYVKTLKCTSLVFAIKVP